MYKSFVLYLLFLALLLPYARAQNPFEEWAPVGAKWYYGCDSAFILESKKDVIFQGKPCRLIESNEYTAMAYCFSGGNANVLRLYTYKEGDKVYLWYPNHNQWGIFYDFGAQKGDTLTLLNPYYGCGIGDVAITPTFRIAVDSAYTKVLNGKELKTIYIAPIVELYDIFFVGEIIENIGNVYIFTPIFGTDENTFHYTILLRYQAPEAQYIPENFYIIDGPTYVMSIRDEYCPQFITQRSQSLKKQEVRLGYNPSGQTISLIFPNSDTEKFLTYDIIDVMGRTVKSENITLYTPLSNIDVQNLASGVYVFRLKNSSTQLSFKFFKF